MDAEALLPRGPRELCRGQKGQIESAHCAAVEKQCHMCRCEELRSLRSLVKGALARRR